MKLAMHREDNLRPYISPKIASLITVELHSYVVNLTLKGGEVSF